MQRALLAAAIVGVASSAWASSENFRVGAWQGQSVSAANGPSYCVARVRQTNGISLSLAVDTRQRLRIGASSPRWTFPPGRRIGVMFRFDEAQPHSTTATVANSGSLWINIENTEALQEALGRASKISVYAGGLISEYRTERVDEVITELQACVQRVAANVSSVQPPAAARGRDQRADQFLSREAEGSAPAFVERSPEGPRGVARSMDARLGGVAMPQAVTNGGRLSPAEVYRMAAPSIHLVLADQNGSGQWSHIGSAVAIASDTLLTNCHVVERAMRVELRQGETRIVPRLISGDSRTDRCLLKVDDVELTPVRGIRAHDSVEIGEPAYTVGNPSGLERTLGQGIVSGLRRWNDMIMVQTTAQMSPGSSGGGLFDARGNLLGVTTFIVQSGQAAGHGFAIAGDQFWR
jgi:S1-C subfamily serine protease